MIKFIKGIFKVIFGFILLIMLFNTVKNRIYGTISYSGKNAFGVSKMYIGKISVNLNKDFTIDSKDKTSKFVIQ